MKTPREITSETGTINANEAYSMPEFCRRTGLREWTIREARRDGLRVVKVGKKPFVMGSDWLEYLRQIASPPTN